MRVSIWHLKFTSMLLGTFCLATTFLPVFRQYISVNAKCRCGEEKLENRWSTSLGGCSLGTASFAGRVTLKFGPGCTMTCHVTAFVNVTPEVISHVNRSIDKVFDKEWPSRPIIR